MAESMEWRAVADRQEISQLVYRYCRSMDRIDPELGYTVWHEDAVADYGADIYQGTGRGFIDWVCAAHRNALVHSHQVSNILIQLDGDRASSESYVTSTMRTMRGDKLLQIINWGRYVDQWSRRDGRWGIDKRIAVIDFDEIREVVSASKRSHGSRDRNDPSYGVLRDPA